RPAGHAAKPGDWRTLRVEVSPARVRVQWEGKVVGELAASDLEKTTRQSLQSFHKSHPENPALAGLIPGFDLQGGVGLGLYESSASFRNVRVEPPSGATAKK